MNDTPTLFTRIIQGEIPATIVYEDEHCIAIQDIAPIAPVHILVITREPIPSMAESTPGGAHQHLLDAAAATARKLGLTSYRLVVNTGPDAGQTVPHLHMHLLGGRDFSWPPG